MFLFLALSLSLNKKLAKRPLSKKILSRVRSDDEWVSEVKCSDIFGEEESYNEGCSSDAVAEYEAGCSSEGAFDYCYMLAVCDECDSFSATAKTCKINCFKEAKDAMKEACDQGDEDACKQKEMCNEHCKSLAGWAIALIVVACVIVVVVVVVVIVVVVRKRRQKVQAEP